MRNMLACLQVVCTVAVLSHFHGLEFYGQQKFSRRSILAAVNRNCTHFDYLVIGGGSGGISSAKRAASHGAKVGLIEFKPLGGTCVNVGCVPKKCMFNAALVSEILHEAGRFGFSVPSGCRFDWLKIKIARDAYVSRLNSIYSRSLTGIHIKVINGFGSFSGPKEVTVGDKKFTADNILIAVGGKPLMLDIPGIEHCITSDGFFALKDQPKKVAVIGGGYIGVELAGIFQALGTKTTLFTRYETLLRGFDEMIVENLQSEMKKQGLQQETSVTAIAVRKTWKGLFLQVEGKVDDGKPNLEFGPFDQILVAIGRQPLLDGLNLAAAGVQLDAKGKIKVDEYQRTTAPNVFAVGDCTDTVELTPTAIMAGRRLSDRLFHNIPKAKGDFENVPTVVFSNPVIGTVGLTEEEAVTKYGTKKIKCFTSKFTNLWYGPWDMNPDDKPKTAMKLVTLLPDEKVLGIHIIGKGADEMLQGFGVALKMGATKKDLDSCVAIHPTASEELVTMFPWGLPSKA